MAKIFGFRPWEVDEIDFERVLGMLSMEANVRKKEKDQLKDSKRIK